MNALTAKGRSRSLQSTLSSGAPTSFCSCVLIVDWLQQKRLIDLEDHVPETQR
jgi:hypothetical protein